MTQVKNKKESLADLLRFLARTSKELRHHADTNVDDVELCQSLHELARNTESLTTQITGLLEDDRLVLDVRDDKRSTR